MSRKGIAGIVTGALVALAVGYDCFFVVDESEQGVLTHFGKISPPVREPGLHLKWPRPISKAYKVDRRKQVLGGLGQELISIDQKNVLVDGFVVWRVVEPVRFVEAVRTRAAAVARLKELYLSSSGIVIGNEARDTFISVGLQHRDMGTYADDILERIKPVARKEYGIDVTKVGIVKYTLPPENRPSMIQRMIAERARIASRYRSEGEEQALKIEALGINEHDKIMAEAHADATRIMGKAEAEALKLLGDAYRKDPEFYKFLRALDSYDSIIDEKTTLMLPLDSELFRYLDAGRIPGSADNGAASSAPGADPAPGSADSGQAPEPDGTVRLPSPAE